MPDQLNPFASPQADPEPGYANWATCDPAALRRVKLGLTLVYGSICALIVLSITIPLVFMSLRIGQGGEAIALLLGGTFLLLTLLMFAGMILCLAAPEASRAKGFALAAVVLQGVVFATSGLISLPLIVGLQIQPPTTALPLSILANLLEVASLTCFVLFLRRMALFIARRDVAGRALRVLVVGGIALLLLAIGTMTGWMSQGNSLSLLQLPTVLHGLGSLGVLVAFVMYANSVTYLRKAITA